MMNPYQKDIQEEDTLTLLTRKPEEQNLDSMIKRHRIYQKIQIGISVCVLIGTLILMIEYNIAIAKFNGGFTGFGNFIKNSTWMVNQMNTIMTSINTTETLDYIHKTMAIIDAICREGMVNCSDHV